MKLKTCDVNTAVSVCIAGRCGVALYVGRAPPVTGTGPCTGARVRRVSSVSHSHGSRCALDVHALAPRSALRRLGDGATIDHDVIHDHGLTSRHASTDAVKL